MRGSGFVDFVGERIWTTDRLVTDRIAMERERQTRGVGRVMNRFVRNAFDRVVGSELYYSGGARWKRGRRGWVGPEGSFNGPKDTWHPLFFLEMLADPRLELPQPSATGDSAKRETRVDLRLGPEQLAPTTLASFSKNSGADELELIRASVWFDEKLHLRRVSIEAVQGEDAASSLWLISEFSEFGTPFNVPNGIPDLISTRHQSNEEP